jgi:energy-coupling factor transporter ATP-binding protein EcfA2
MDNQHTLWSYLEADVLRHQHLVILGPPGSGKTTLLKHLALTLVNQKKKRTLSRRLQRAYRLPFLLFLREYIQALQCNADFSLVNAIESHLAGWERPVPEGWVQRQLSAGKCLILLDGLDEVADQNSREQMAKWVQAQMTRYAANRFLLTSRPFGYRANQLSGVAILEVQPFTFKQIKQFVQKWYQANEIMSSRKDDAGVRMRAKAGAQDLVQRMQQTPALAVLAVNPLLLTMIATIHRYRSTLPGKRVELYADICEVFLGKRQQARDQQIELRPAQSVSVLQPLAYAMMVRNQREITAQEAQEIIREPLLLVSGQISSGAQLSAMDFLHMVENMSGLLLSQKTGSYSFAHLTFQEYLAAVYICEHKLGVELLASLGKSWWAETIRLYCAQTDATQIIEACLSQIKPTHSSVAYLELALECFEEAFQVHPTLKQGMDKVIEQGARHTDPALRTVVAETLLKRRLKEMIPMEGEVYRDSSLINCIEYQLFLDECNQQDNAYQPEHWHAPTFLPGEALLPVLGVRPSAARAFCTWLTQREQGVWLYRLPQLEECQAEMVRSHPDRQRHYGYWREQQTAFTWLREPREGTINPLDLDIGRVDGRRSAVKLDKEIDWRQQLLMYIALASDLASVSVSVNDLVSALDLAHAHDLARSLGRASALTRVSDLTLASDLALARSLVSDIASVSARAFAHALASASVSDLASASVSDLASASVLALASASASARDLAHFLNLAHHLVSTSNSAFMLARQPGPFYDFLIFARLFALLSVCVSLNTYGLQSEALQPPFLQQLFSRPKKKNQDQAVLEIQRILNKGIEMSQRFECLEKRRRGEEPAYEGILIIRERMQT